MLKLHLIHRVKTGGMEFDTYAILRDGVYPIVEPTIFLANVARKCFSTKTVRAYGNDLLMFFRELSEVNGTNGLLGQNFRDVTDNEMNAYLNAYLRRKHNLKLRSIKRHITTLRSFYEYAYSHGWMSERKRFSFAVRRDETKTSELEGISKQLAQAYITPEDFKEKVLDSIPAHNLFKCKRDRLALMLGYYAGFRTHELVHPNNLRIDDLEKLITLDERGIPFIDKQMSIHGKGNKVRSVRVWPELIQSLYDFLKMAKSLGARHLMCRQDGSSLSDESFGSDLFRDTADLLLLDGKLTSEEAELWKLRHYHGLRKCYATNAVTYCYKEQYDHRVFVTKWMGHSDPSTTEIYIYFEAILNHRTQIFNEINLDKMLNSFHKAKKRFN